MGAQTLLDRLDTALVSCAVKFWSELLAALAFAGQSAAGVRCFPFDPPSADERLVALDWNSLEMSEGATSLNRPVSMPRHARADPGCTTGVTVANGTRVPFAEEVAPVPPRRPEIGA